MEENIFNGAKFGDRFVTKNGKIAVYINNDAMRFHYLGIEPCTVSGTQIVTFRYVESGKVDAGYRDSLDIISRYKEPLDEDKLDELADKHIGDTMFCHDGALLQYGKDCFKAGYRKAKEV